MTPAPSTHILDRLREHAGPCALHPWVPLLARALTRRGGQGAVALGERLPLYLLLLILAHRRSGLVLAVKRGLVDALGIGATALAAQLLDLEKLELIGVKEPGPFLVLSVRSWPGRRASESLLPAEPRPGNRAELEASDPPSTPPPGSAPEFCSAGNIFLNRSGEAAEQGRAEADRGDGVRGLGSGEEGWREPFLDRLVGVLGHPEERASYRTFSGKYPRAILEAALRRVMAMPRDRIRKNPGALFTYLVKTMTR